MASVRKRIRNGKMEGWIADYFDQNKKRHIKTFRREKDAKAWLDTVKIEVGLAFIPLNATALRLPRLQSCGSSERRKLRSSRPQRCGNTRIMCGCTSTRESA